MSCNNWHLLGSFFQPKTAALAPFHLQWILWTHIIFSAVAEISYFSSPHPMLPACWLGNICVFICISNFCILYFVFCDSDQLSPRPRLSARLVRCTDGRTVSCELYADRLSCCPVLLLTAFLSTDQLYLSQLLSSICLQNKPNLFCDIGLPSPPVTAISDVCFC